MAKKNEGYVLDLCDEALGKTGLREHTFDWLLGDPSPKTGKRTKLRVDAYWPSFKLVVEFHEKQHTEAVGLFDKPDKLTLSGVHRGIQRKIYDDRRRLEIPAHGLHLAIISMSDFVAQGNSILRRHEQDLNVVKRALTGVCDKEE